MNLGCSQIAPQKRCVAGIRPHQYPQGHHPEGQTSATFADVDGRVFNLGSQTVTNTLVGNPVIMQGTTPILDFSATAVAGYNYTFSDPNDVGDAASASYQMRWAVISTVNAGVVISKRFIVGCRRAGNANNQIKVPAIVDTMVQK